MTAINDYRIPELMPYVNWSYFYFAWGVKAAQPEAREVRAEAERMMHHLSLNGVRVRAAFRLLPAYSDGDDVVLLAEDENAAARNSADADAAVRHSADADAAAPLLADADAAAPSVGRLAFLRQQHTKPDAPCLCLADFIAPQGYDDPAHVADRLGLFATTVSASHECPCCSGDVLLMQTVKDRLAEAAAEVLHLQVRRQHWGYAPDEPAPAPGHSGFEDHLRTLHLEHFQGIRPAVGYPSLPDQSFIFDLARLLPFDELGIRLTENGMMQPHASTCGLMFAHPAARYFAVGPVGDDQLTDYARRRGRTAEELRKFLPL